MHRIFHNKKGLQQADWAISITVFTVYLILFFIAVKPLISPPSKVDSILADIEDRFVENTTVQVERLPVLLKEATEQENEPIIVSLPYSWDAENIAVSEGYFVLDEGRVLFFGNTTEKTTYSISHSTDFHETDSELFLMSQAEEAGVADLKVEFTESIPSRYTYRGEPRIKSLALTVDGTELDAFSTYEDHTSIAKYLAEGVLNHTTYVFAENPRTYTYAKPIDYLPHNLSLVLSLYNYTEYYVDESNFAGINYLVDKCREFSTDKIDVNDGSTGITFMFGENVDIELCNNATYLGLRADYEIDSNEEASYLIFLHRSDQEDTEQYPIKPVIGFKQNIDSTSYREVSGLSALDYEILKKTWAVAYDRDFKIVFKSDDYNTTIGIEPPLVDVYAKHMRLFNYDGMDFEDVNVVITTWGGS